MENSSVDELILDIAEKFHVPQNKVGLSRVSHGWLADIRVGGHTYEYEASSDIEALKGLLSHPI
jgi:hypothetical protein